MNSKKILFYSSVSTKKMFSVQQFYRTDISILRKMNYKVLLSNNVFDFLAFWKYDIAFIYFYRYGFFSALFAKFFQKKVIFTGGIDYLDSNYSSFLNLYIQRIFFRLCSFFSDLNIIVSNSDLDNIKKFNSNLDLLKNPLSFHVIDLQKIENYPKIKKQKLVVTIAWMGRIENVFRKGVDKAVMVFNELVKLDPEYRMLIIGSKGEGSKYIQNLIHKLKLEDKIKLTGSINENDKLKALMQSEIYMQISKYEGFGIAAIEAAACKNLVVHSNKGGLRDSIGNNGLIVCGNEYFIIAKQILESIKTISTQNKINQGIIQIKKNFAYPNRLKNFKSFFKQFGI